MSFLLFDFFARDVLPTREWLLFGNLNNGSGNAGLSAGNGNNDLSNANWNIAGRLPLEFF